MADNFVYVLNGTAYVNLTNKCHNACAFCIRNSGDGVAGVPLWLDREPECDEVMAAFDKLAEKVKNNEVVFCGYGEPTERLEQLKSCAKEFKARGLNTRLNTNGLGSAVNGRDISGDLDDIDIVSVSLNQCDAQKYYEITRSQLGLSAFDEVLAFACALRDRGRRVVFTVVDTIDKTDIAACKRLCLELKIPLRVRKYVADNYNN